jgi:predicted RNase H-like HicB family nuclease
MTFEEYMAVPYVLRVAAVMGTDGRWLRRAEYPELPGCFGEGLSPEEALAALDRNRQRLVRQRLAAGEDVPVPRRPLARLMRSRD